MMAVDHHHHHHHHHHHRHLTGLSSTLFLMRQASMAVDPKWAVMFVASLPSNTTGENIEEPEENFFIII